VLVTHVRTGRLGETWLFPGDQYASDEFLGLAAWAAPGAPKKTVTGRGTKEPGLGHTGPQVSGSLRTTTVLAVNIAAG
jgi:hypothetical protein